MTDEQKVADFLLTVKEAVEKRDWQLVCDSYNLLTGDNLQLSTKKKVKKTFSLKNVKKKMSKPVKKNIKKIKTPIAADAEVREDELQDITNGKTINDMVKDEAVKHRLHKTPVTLRPDEMRQVRLITTDCDGNMVERNEDVSKHRDRQERSAPVMFDVKCQICGKVFKSIAKETEFYGQRCNECSKNAPRS